VILRPWLYRLTLNRCYNHLRWSARRPLAGREHDQPSPHDPYEQSELQALLETSLGDLTRRQRAAILLKDVHGLSLVEVGACLDMTPGSVEVLLARARRAFRVSYEARCVAAGRPVPGSSGALAALVLLPLPLGLSAPPLALPAVPVAMPPVAPVAPVAPFAAGPLAAATGGGIGALLGLPTSIKTAVLVAAAAASLGSAELVATRADERPPRPEVRAAVAADPGPLRTAAVETTAVHTASAPETPSASPRAAGPTPSPAASSSAEPSPQGSPLGIVTPSPSASATPDASPPATSSPDPHATTPSPTASPSATPSPSPSPSTGPDSSPSPSPGL
jgi:hypothetical protein